MGENRGNSFRKLVSRRINIISLILFELFRLGSHALSLLGPAAARPDRPPHLRAPPRRIHTARHPAAPPRARRRRRSRRARGPRAAHRGLLGRRNRGRGGTGTGRRDVGFPKARGADGGEAAARGLARGAAPSAATDVRRASEHVRGVLRLQPTVIKWREKLSVF